MAFDCDKWMSGLCDGNFKTRKDGKGVDYILLSPGENADSHAKLKELLPYWFMADSVIIL